MGASGIRLRNYIFIEERGMTEQVPKRLIDEQVKMILDRFIRKELQSEQAMDLLGLKRSQFFEWVSPFPYWQFLSSPVFER